MRRLWVIEMVVGAKDGEPVWEPTVGCGVTRDQARQEIIRWQEDNPADRFRVKEYLPYDIEQP